MRINGSFILLSVIIGMQGVAQNPQIEIATDLGTMRFEILLDVAPVTAGNFLRYVDENRFEGAVFYRVVRMDNQPENDIKIEVIQGGLKEDPKKQSLPPIAHETTRKTGILHKDGTLSMARLGPGTATGEFFICIGDQPELDFGGKRNPDGQGFAAFGRVVSGMEVVKKIQNLKDSGQYLEKELPILHVTRIQIPKGDD